MLPCKHTKNQNILSLAVILLPFLPSLCCTLFSTFIFPISISLCARVSNELVWFPFPATGIFFLPSPSSLPYPPLPHLLSCFLLSMPLLPQGLSRLLFLCFFFCYPLHSFLFHIPMVLWGSNKLHYHGLPTEVARARPMWSSSVLKVWKMYEHLYRCPRARHRQHHPRLCARMFKWEAFPHTWCITRTHTCKHTAVWKATL